MTTALVPQRLTSKLSGVKTTWASAPHEDLWTLCKLLRSFWYQGKVTTAAVNPLHVLSSIKWSLDFIVAGKDALLSNRLHNFNFCLKKSQRGIAQRNVRRLPVKWRGFAQAVGL